MTIKAFGYATHSATSKLAPFHFERRDPKLDDVTIEILYCGVCHSDLHQARNDWNNTIYPVVPGHEMIGRVTAVGANVTRFKIGDHAGVGCMVHSCLTCDACEADLEQYCRCGPIFTYNTIDPRDGQTDLWRLFRPDRRLRALRRENSARASISGARRRCSARASRPGRRCAIGRSASTARSP